MSNARMNAELWAAALLGVALVSGCAGLDKLRGDMGLRLRPPESGAAAPGPEPERTQLPSALPEPMPAIPES